MEITAYGIPLSPVTSLKFIGRVLVATDNDWPTVVHNLQRAWKKWAQMTRVLSREGADTQTLVHIY